MAAYQGLIRSLRRAEQQLERQLAGVRTAISSLHFGSAVSPAAPAAGPRKRTRRVRKMSAAARARIAAAQRARWAKIKASKNK